MSESQSSTREVNALGRVLLALAGLLLMIMLWHWLT